MKKATTTCAIEELVPTTVIDEAMVKEVKTIIEKIEDNQVSQLCIAYQERGTGRIMWTMHATSSLQALGMLEYLKQKVLL